MTEKVPCRILNIEAHRYPEEARGILCEVGEVTNLKLSHNDLQKLIGDYHVLIVGIENSVGSSIIRCGKKLKIIATATTGLDHIDLNAAKKQDIKIISLKREKNFLKEIAGTAEFTFGLTLSLIRDIPRSFDRVKSYRWERKSSHGFELSGKNLGIIGFGRLGKLMAQYGHGFRMQILAYDPYIPSSEMEPFGVIPVSLEDLLKNADVVSLHAELSEETEEMIGKTELNLMKPSSVIINTARGQLIDETALLIALKEKKIAGAALDVLEDENKFDENFNNHPLVEYARTHSNLLITPHIAGMAFDSVYKTRIFITKKIVQAIKESNLSE